GGRSLPSQTWITTRWSSADSHTRTGGVPGAQYPAKRLPVRPADAETALLTSSETTRPAVCASLPSSHAHRTSVACSLAQGAAVARAPSSRKVWCGQAAPASSCWAESAAESAAPPEESE